MVFLKLLNKLSNSAVCCRFYCHYLEILVPVTKIHTHINEYNILFNPHFIISFTLIWVNFHFNIMYNYIPFSALAIYVYTVYSNVYHQNDLFQKRLHINVHALIKISNHNITNTVSSFINRYEILRKQNVLSVTVTVLFSFEVIKRLSWTHCMATTIYRKWRSSYVRRIVGGKESDCPGYLFRLPGPTKCVRFFRPLQELKNKTRTFRLQTKTYSIYISYT